MPEESEPESEPEEPKPLPLPKLGTALGSYKLIKLLGVGGMGRVYVALHQKLGRKVALKLLLPEFAANPEVVQRFFNEARAVNQISHPNIVEIVDFVEDPHGFNYFIMELLDGKDLRKTRDADGPFLLGRTVAIGKQMASALAAAHGQGIIHRDIKPDNVVLMPSEERPNFIKLLDFGIAKLSSGVFHEQKTRLGMVLGTPGYMSPEQAFGRPVDGRSDIYSLGVLLHWMLVDKLPSAGNMPMKTAPKDEPPPDPLRVTARGQPIPTALAELVERCLRFDPDDRVQSMDRVRAALSVIAPTDIRDSAIVRPTTATLTDGIPATPLSMVEGKSGASGVHVADQLQGAPPGATMREIPAMDMAGATRMQAESGAEYAKDAATRIKMDSDRPIGREAEAPAEHAQDEEAAFPPKRGSMIWIAAIAAAIVVAVGAAIVMRPGAAQRPQVAALPPAEAAPPTANPQPTAQPSAPTEPSAPTAQLPPAPEPRPEANSEPKAATPPPTAQAVPPKEAPAAPVPAAAEPAHPAEHELTADDTNKAEAPPKAAPAEHHSKSKKHAKTKAVDDTSILDPLAE